MNREIKFRGRRVDTKEWVYGDLAHLYNGLHFIMPECYFATRNLGQDDKKGISNLLELALGGFIEVEKESLGEFTGFKDKNEKSIYEGDILRDEVDNICIVIFINEWGMFGVVSVERYGAYEAIGIDALDIELVYTFHLENGAFRIVGNIYENPKILE